MELVRPEVLMALIQRKLAVRSAAILDGENLAALGSNQLPPRLTQKMEAAG